jgi:hypothetical protein
MRKHTINNHREHAYNLIIYQKDIKKFNINLFNGNNYNRKNNKFYVKIWKNKLERE